MLSVILPAYNEAANVEKTIHKTVDVLSRTGQPFELILVDDGSKDDTFQKACIVSKTYPNVRVLGYRPNMGKGYALKYGSRFAKGDLVLFLDADLDIPPSQIPIFLDYMEDKKAAVVVGSKRHPLSKLRYPPSRRFLSRCYGLLLKLLFNLNVTDTQVGIKLFRQEVLDRVIPEVKINRFAFDLELLANVSQANYRVVEAPVEIDFHFGSRVNLIQIWRMFVDTLNIFYRLKFTHPSRVSFTASEVQPEYLADKSIYVPEEQLEMAQVIPRKSEQTKISPMREINKK